MWRHELRTSYRLQALRENDALNAVCYETKTWQFDVGQARKRQLYLLKSESLTALAVVYLRQQLLGYCQYQT